MYSIFVNSNYQEKLLLHYLLHGDVYHMTIVLLTYPYHMLFLTWPFLIPEFDIGRRILSSSSRRHNILYPVPPVVLQQNQYAEIIFLIKKKGIPSCGVHHIGEQGSLEDLLFVH